MCPARVVVVLVSTATSPASDSHGPQGSREWPNAGDAATARDYIAGTDVAVFTQEDVQDGR